MNRRIKKKKEKQSIMEYSFEFVPVYSYKRRKEIVNQQWKMFHNEGIKILIGYKKGIE